MKILAIEKEAPPQNVEIPALLLEEEAGEVWRMTKSGALREIYFTEKRNAVLILEADNLKNAKEILNKLPLVKSGAIEFEVMELKPYDGFERLMGNKK